MGKHPIDHDRPRDDGTAREYARVEREKADPLSDPKVKAMNKAREDDTAREAEKFSQLEREKADPLSDPKVKAMTRGAHKDEDKSLLTRLRKFLNIDRQGTES